MVKKLQTVYVVYEMIMLSLSLLFTCVSNVEVHRTLNSKNLNRK